MGWGGGGMLLRKADLQQDPIKKKIPLALNERESPQPLLDRQRRNNINCNIKQTGSTGKLWKAVSSV